MHLPADALVVLVLVVVAIDDVLDVAILRLDLAHQFGGNRIGKRAVHEPLYRPQLIVTCSGADIGLEILGGAPGKEADRTPHHVFAEQGALGAAQHLDPLQVIQVGGAAGGAPDIDLVDKGRDSRVTAGGIEAVAHAANEVLGLADIELGHTEIRGLLGDVTHAADQALPDQVAADGTDRDRHVLQAFRPLLRGNYHFFQCGSLRLRHERQCQQYCGKQRGIVAGIAHGVMRPGRSTYY